MSGFPISKGFKKKIKEEIDLHNLPFIEKEIKGENNISFILKIYNAKQSLIFYVKKINDFSEIIYKKEFTLEKFYQLDNFFKSFKSLEEIYEDIFKNYKKKEIFVLENEYIIIINIKFEILNKIKEIAFIFDDYNLNVEKIVLKLCDKIKEIDILHLYIKQLEEKLEKYKLSNEQLNNKIDKEIKNVKEEQNEINKNNKKELIGEFNKKLNEEIRIKNEIFDKKLKDSQNGNNKKDLIESKLQSEKNPYSFSKIINIIIHIIIISIISIYLNTNYNKINDLDNQFNYRMHDIYTKLKSFDNKVNDVDKEFHNTTNYIDNQFKSFNNQINYLENCFIYQSLIDDKNYYNYNFLINEGIKYYFFKEIKNVKLLYRASKDGYESYNFHQKCDGKKFTVILIVTDKYKIFGGFTELEWDSNDSFKSGGRGFIFSINNNKIYYNKKKYQIYCSQDEGPDFYEVFYIKGKIGYSYNSPSYSSFEVSGKDKSLVGEKEFSIKDYAVFQIDF